MDRKHSKLKKLDGLIQDTSKRLGIDYKIKELMIMEYWEEIVKGSIAKDCKPYSLYKTPKGNVLNIAAKSSIVASELNMIKLMLLDKINILSTKIGVTVSDMVVSTRYWAELDHKESSSENKEDVYEEKYHITKEEIESVVLDEAEIKQLNDAVESIKDNDKLKDNLKKIIMTDLKMKKCRMMKGYPLCKNCGVVLQRKNVEICPACEYS